MSGRSERQHGHEYHGATGTSTATGTSVRNEDHGLEKCGHQNNHRYEYKKQVLIGACEGIVLWEEE